MSLSLSDWHDRYSEQARWTANLRKFIFDQVGLHRASMVLEVGCGTGAILADIEDFSQAATFGIEISYESANFARSNTRRSTPICADGHHLPFANQRFDLTLVHFVLLWVQNPLAVVQEMVRVTRRGGHILALAEPDYGGRLDFPQELSLVGEWQVESLKEQGADPYIGRRVPTLLKQAGLSSLQAGILGGQWTEQDLITGMNNEWQVVLSDLETLKNPPEPGNVSRIQSLEQTARRQGDRVLFVPTFYAWAQVP